MTSGNKDSNKSDSGGSDDGGRSDDKGERAEKLLNMDRRHIGDKLMKKESSKMEGDFVRSSTAEEMLFLNNNLLPAPKKSVKVLNKQTSVGNVVRQLNSKDDMCRSKSLFISQFAR